MTHLPCPTCEGTGRLEEGGEGPKGKCGPCGGTGRSDYPAEALSTEALATLLEARAKGLRRKDRDVLTDAAAVLRTLPDW